MASKGSFNLAAGFNPSTAATGPLQFTYVITTQVSVVTNVFGDARNMASVEIRSGSVPVWIGSMTQAAPKAVTPVKLILGDTTIEAGATFTLTIPTSLQNGNVLMQANIASGSNPPTPFAAIIASWPLSSAQ